MALLTRHVGRQVLLRQPSTLLAQRSNMASRPTAFEEMSRYWEVNRKLKRPLSPVISIYKYHLTMNISITNRAAAVALSGGLCLGSIALMCLPGDYKTYIDMLRDAQLGPVIIYTGKFILAFPFAYHLVAGMRHLIWDLGYGFSKPASYQGSLAVVVLTVLFTAYLMFGVKPSAV